MNQGSGIKQGLLQWRPGLLKDGENRVLVLAKADETNEVFVSAIFHHGFKVFGENFDLVFFKDLAWDDLNVDWFKLAILIDLAFD